MRSCSVVMVVLCLASLSFPQLQLAPNAACDNNAPFCRASVSPVPGTESVPAIIGFHAGVLYGSITVQAGDSCPGTGTNTTAPGTLCFYSTNTFKPENWSYLDQFSTQDVPNAIEVVFAPGSCSNKYVYTTGQHLLTATNSPTDWSFTDIIHNLPGTLPSDMTARPGSFLAANQPAGTRLFYAKYSNGPINPCPDPVPPAYIWYSDDCGSTWAYSHADSPIDPAVANSFGGREVHAINVDPANSSIIYANVDTECAKTATSLGLWKSTDGGMHFQHASNSTTRIGIDFVFPRVTNKLFMEVDNNAVFNPTGPLFSWDKLNGINNPLVPAPWPLPVISGEPAWSTAFANSINLTSEQNIFVATLAAQNVSDRMGTWYFAPPFYDVAVPLEDFQPPINTISASGGTATVHTFEAHSLHAGDTVTIVNATPTGFNLANVVATVGNDPTQFTYLCPNCPASGGGGYVAKGVEFFSRTVEVTGPPPQNTAFLYSERLRMVKPQFITPPLPAAGSALTTFVDQGGGQHWIYEGTNQHLYDLFWKSGSGIGFADITSSASASAAATGSALSSFVDSGGSLHVIYLGGNQHLFQALWSPSGSYSVTDVTTATGAPVAASGSSLSAFLDSGGGQHWIYQGTNQHLYQATWVPNAGFGYLDLTALIGAPAGATGTSITTLVDLNGGQHWIYLGSNQHVYDTFWVPNRGVGFQDLTSAAGTSAAAAGSALSSFVDSGGGLHVIYLGPNQHAYQVLWLPGGSVGATDLMTATGAPVAAAGSALSSLIDSGGGQHWIYLGANQHAYQATWVPNAGFGYEDRTADTGAPVAASGSALNSFIDPNGGQHFVYFGADQHMEQANWIPNVGLGFTDLHAR